MTQDDAPQSRPDVTPANPSAQQIDRTDRSLGVPGKNNPSRQIESNYPLDVVLKPEGSPETVRVQLLTEPRPCGEIQDQANRHHHQERT